MRIVFYTIVLFISACGAVAPVYAADAGACYSIQNADARTYCLARAREDASQCYAIQSADLRAACLAEVRK